MREDDQEDVDEVVEEMSWPRTHRRRKPRGMVLAEDSVSGSQSHVCVEIRPQCTFYPKKISFAGSDENLAVTSIQFGDRCVWKCKDGLRSDVLESLINDKALFDSHRVKRGLSIWVEGFLPQKGKMMVTFAGIRH